jgi:hypothetical protein
MTPAPSHGTPAGDAALAITKDIDLQATRLPNDTAEMAKG